MAYAYSRSIFRAILGLSLGLSATAAHAQAPTPVSISNATAVYTQNFDGMGATGTTSAYPAGWAGLRLGGTGTLNDPLTPAVVTDASNAGGVYNAGSNGGTDRALGSLASGSTIPAFGAVFSNQTGAAVTTLNLAARAEQWRTSSDALVESLLFEYSLDATSLSTGTWTAVPALNINERAAAVATVGPIDGNAAANSAAVSAVITLNWPANTTLWVRWKDTNDVGADALLAVDDFRLSLSPLGTRAARASALSVYPNPTSDLLVLRQNGRPATGPVSVTDLAGRTVLATSLTDGTLDVRTLPAGSYMVLTADGAAYKLVKR